MRIALFIVVLMLSVGLLVACGGKGERVAVGHDAQGREFVIWNDGKALTVGWTDEGELEEILKLEPGVHVSEIVVMDCDGDGADDVVITGETVLAGEDREKYFASITLNGSLLPGSSASGGVSGALKYKSDSLPYEAVTYCLDAKDRFEGLREHLREKVQ